jgi:hypothetical protein
MASPSDLNVCISSLPSESWHVCQSVVRAFSLSLPTCAASWGEAYNNRPIHTNQQHQHHHPFADISLDPVSLQDIVGIQPSSANQVFAHTDSSSTTPVPGERARLRRVRSPTSSYYAAASAVVSAQLDLPSQGSESPEPVRSMARVYADVNANMPRSYWDYDSVNISWGALENYEVVRKIGKCED